MKDLKKIWSQGFDESQTLLLDDSPYKATLSFIYSLFSLELENISFNLLPDLCL